LVPLMFVLSGSGCIRYLHSFPTRRSSDLASIHPIAPHCRSARTYGNPISIHFAVVLTGVPTLPTGDLTRPRQVTCGECRYAREEDRKSTRLNSSHVEISYAVFCLKKKK